MVYYLLDSRTWTSSRHFPQSERQQRTCYSPTLSPHPLHQHPNLSCHLISYSNKKQNWSSWPTSFTYPSVSDLPPDESCGLCWSACLRSILDILVSATITSYQNYPTSFLIGILVSTLNSHSRVIKKQVDDKYINLY